MNYELRIPTKQPGLESQAVFLSWLNWLCIVDSSPNIKSGRIRFQTAVLLLRIGVFLGFLGDF